MAGIGHHYLGSWDKGLACDGSSKNTVPPQASRIGRALHVYVQVHISTP